MKDLEIIVLCGGGSSAEKEVSLRSGNNVFNIISQFCNTQKFELIEDALPESIKQKLNQIILPIMHGSFGEDGQLQKIMEDRGLNFVGCDSKTSALCMDKVRTKEIIFQKKIPTLPYIAFSASDKPLANEIISKLGVSLVVKPSNSGSSLDIQIIHSKQELTTAIDHIETGTWIIEKRAIGHDITVAMLDGKAIGMVEIISGKEFLSYDDKYTADAVIEKCPPLISNNLQNTIKKYAETAFAACNCRDISRIDFILDKEQNPFFLEINTMPGMTLTSFFPLIALTYGLSMEAVLKKLIALAQTRTL